MENNIKTKPESRKNFDWNSLFSFSAEIAKLILVTGLTVYVSEKVKRAVNSHDDADNVVDFSAARVSRAA